MSVLGVEVAGKGDEFKHGIGALGASRAFLQGERTVMKLVLMLLTRCEWPELTMMAGSRIPSPRRFFARFLLVFSR